MAPMIPVSRPSIGEEELDAVKRVFETGWLGLGSVVYDFENALKEYLGAKNVIAVNTGTSALHIALDGVGTERGDEVIVPSLTFAATIQAIVAVGAVPVFCDIDADTLNISIEDVKRRITSKTKIIMPVHYCGNPCDMDSLIAIAKESNLTIIEDAAHGFGSTYKGAKIGSIGDITCFSFDPIKNITCGEGGAVVLENDDVAEIIRRKRILGIDKDSWYRYKNEKQWFYEVTTKGYRYHMSNINAAIGLVQLKKIDKFISKRREIAKRYNVELGNIESIRTMNIDYDTIAPFAYIIRVMERRDELMEYMAGMGIDTGVHYIPNHIHPLFNQYSSPLPVTEKVWREIITLPLFYDMSENEMEKVIAGITQFFS